MTSRADPLTEEKDDPPFLAGELPPRKVAWLHPLELVRTGYHALISRVATGFLDRREMLAAIDEGDPPGHISDNPTLVRDKDVRSAPYCTLRTAADTVWQGKEGIWIDFVADLGDSWDATYATALLIAQRRLKVRGHVGELPQASVVVLGGDLVYPTPSRNAYGSRLRSAFIAAMPEKPPGRTPCLLAIPGNHDWYDGLTNFVREFCQGGLFGGWQLVQSRSYFAAKVAPGWWIWGIDIALDTRIDSPQQAYFIDIMRNRSQNPTHGPPHQAEFVNGDRVILCTAKPVWLDDPRHSDDAYRNLAYFVRRVMEEHGATAPIILAGDLHHYSRYENDMRQLITSGGGGAYLTGTHHLPARVKALHSDAGTASGQAKVARAPEESYRATQFPYPSRADSRHLAMRALMLACRVANWPFAFTVGAIAWLMAWPLRSSLNLLFERPRQTFLMDVWTVLVREEFLRSYAVALVILAGCALYALAVNEKSKLLRALWGIVHGKAHIVTAMAIAWLTASGNVVDRAMQRLSPDWKLPIWLTWLPEFALGVVFVLLAAVAGATLVGLYLVLSDRLFGWHRNDVFSAQSIIGYRNFLRLHIQTDGSVMIYPIGLRQVPRQWRARVAVEPVVVPETTTSPPEQQAPPYYEPGDYELRPHLIEAPIRILP